MPRYDYRCTECASEFELVQKFSEAGQGDCPACGGAGQRVFHAVPVIYKGSGFYTTDYGRPKRPAESSESKDSSSAESSTDSGNSSGGGSGDSASSGSGGSSGAETAPAAAGSSAE